jgi:sigma-B regulation protein RsbU (phosphoserine phosphatase)
MNKELARDNERQFFVTALVGRLALGSGELIYCNAGHPRMLHARAGGQIETLGTADADIALGVVDSASYREARVHLAAGDVLLLFTDGVTEAINATSELFSDDRLLKTLGEAARRPAKDIVEHVVAGVRAFAGGTAQEDDITLLALRYTP